MRKYGIIVLLIVLVSTTQGATESVSLGSYEINVDSVVEVPIVINNATDVAGGKVTVGFNSSIITFVGVLPGDFGAPITMVDSSGKFVVVSSALATAAGKNEAILAVVKFRGVGAGNTVLTIEREYYFNDIKGNLYIPFTKNGSITVRPLALPATEKSPTITQETKSPVPSTDLTPDQATIKNTSSATPSPISTQIFSSHPNETAVLPVETKKTPGFEACILILIFLTLLVHKNIKKIPKKMRRNL